MGEAMGADLSRVRIHTGAEPAQLARSVQAAAFTHGTDIYFDDANYAPQSQSGQRLLAHELAHTVQQNGGEASGVGPLIGRSADPAEAEADRVASRVIRTLQRSARERVDQSGEPPTARNDSSTSSPAVRRTLTAIPQHAGPAGATAAQQQAAGNSTVVRRSWMRGDKPVAKPKVGDQAPSTRTIVLGRFQAIIRDAGYEPRELFAAAMRAFLVAHPRTYSVHPLEELDDEHSLVATMHNVPANEYDDYKEFADMVAHHYRLDFKKRHPESDLPSSVQTAGRILELLEPFDRFFAAGELALYADGRLRNAELSTAIAATAGNNPHHRDVLDLLADTLPAAQARPQLPEPDQDSKTALTNFLKSLPIVDALLKGRAWELGEGGALLKGWDITGGAENQAHFEKYLEQFVENLRQGLMLLSAMVEPARRPPADRVSTVEINPDEVEELLFRDPRIKKFRAESTRAMDKVQLSVMNEVPAVVHELGHQVEFALPIAVWMDLLQILQSRSGGKPLADIYGNGKEVAFQAAMPAFEEIYGADSPSAKYPAKVYSTGDTEVVSTTMEMLSQPAKALVMVEKDPVLVATVLRAIRPSDFVGFPANLTSLLPG